MNSSAVCCIDLRAWVVTDLICIPDIDKTRQVSTIRAGFGMNRGHPRIELTFVLDTKPLSPSISNRSSPKPMRIVGLLIRLDVTNATDVLPAIRFNTPDLGLLRAQFENRCALRAVIIAFKTFEHLEIITRHNPSLRDPWTGVGVYRLAYGGGEFSSRRVVGIDPTTLESTGMLYPSPANFVWLVLITETDPNRRILGARTRCCFICR